MAFSVRTLTVTPAGVRVRRGSGYVTLVNRDSTNAMYVAAADADLDSAATRDSIAATKSIEVNLPGRKDELWVASAHASDSISVAVYET